MEQCRGSCAVVALLFGLWASAPAIAKDECITVKKCAEDMVTLANQLKQENAALIARIVALEVALTRQGVESATMLEQRIARVKTGTDQYAYPGGNGVSGLCPPSTYMVGARWQVDGGGPHGIMSWIGPICRTMP